MQSWVIVNAAATFCAHLTALRFHEAFSMLAEDGRYIVPGTTPVSRVYAGRRDLLNNLLPVLGGFAEPPVLIFRDPIVSGDRVVMLGAGNGVGPTGPYDQPYYAFIGQVRGDEFVEIIEFMDLVMLETGVFGKKLVST